MANPRKLPPAFLAALWKVECTSLPRWKAWLMHALRLSYVVARDLTVGELGLWAMSLVYTTLLSLVPLLAVSFSVLKAFGVHSAVEPVLLNLLAPLGEKSSEITRQIIQFIDNMKVEVLGSVGLGLLIYTVISLLAKIEQAFNAIWHVDKQRPLARRFSDYLSVLIIGPVLVFSALGITASMMHSSVVQDLLALGPLLGTLVETAGRLLPYLLMIGAFTFLYAFVPNTSVRLTSALTGAIVAGVLWQTSGWIFASFIATSTQYAAIYSALATPILFMIWVYLAWLILLSGASIAFYHQHTEYLVNRRGGWRLSNRMREQLALHIMVQIARNYYHDGPMDLEALAKRLQVPTECIEPVIRNLTSYGVLARTDGLHPAYVPRRALETIHLKEVLTAAVHTASEESESDPPHMATDPAVEKLLDGMNQALAEVLQGRTVKDLLLAGTRDDASAMSIPRAQAGAAGPERGA